MNYRSELSAFHDCLEKWDLSSCEISLWHALWDVAMICGSTDSLSVAASTLALRTGFQKKSIERARKRLSDFGILRYKSRGGNKSAVYDLVSLVGRTGAQRDPQTAPQTGPYGGAQTAPQTGPISTTTSTMRDSSRKITRHTDAQRDPQTAPYDTPQPLISDAEAFALQADLDDVLRAAADIGIPQNASDLDKANRLLAEYTAPWVLEAVSRAGDSPAGARSWRYVEGILRKWRERGGIDDVRAPSAAGTRDDAEALERRRREEARILARLRGELPK